MDLQVLYDQIKTFCSPSFKTSNQYFNIECYISNDNEITVYIYKGTSEVKEINIRRKSKWAQ